MIWRRARCALGAGREMTTHLPDLDKIRGASGCLASGERNSCPWGPLPRCFLTVASCKCRASPRTSSSFARCSPTPVMARRNPVRNIRYNSSVSAIGLGLVTPGATRTSALRSPTAPAPMSAHSLPSRRRHLCATDYPSAVRSSPPPRAARVQR